MDARRAEGTRDLGLCAFGLHHRQHRGVRPRFHPQRRPRDVGKGSGRREVLRDRPGSLGPPEGSPGRERRGPPRRHPGRVLPNASVRRGAFDRRNLAAGPGNRRLRGGLQGGSVRRKTVRRRPPQGARERRRDVGAHGRTSRELRSARRQRARRRAGVLQAGCEAQSQVKHSAVVLVAALAAGCSPALREPPSVASLASKPAPVTLTDSASLLREADLRWAKRPDVEAVKEAEALYLRAAGVDESDVLGLIGATRTKAWLIEHQRDTRVRAETAVSAVQTAQWCGRRRPELPACDYWLAVAVGLQAREVRVTADDGLQTIVPALQRAIEGDPTYDDAGPHRVMALVLVRAPGWPLGPGDVEAGLAQARQAVALRPEYPPNIFALAEALATNKDREQARAIYIRGKVLAAARRDVMDPDAPFWIVQ